jgi:membrane associated rhomboid family serine protease
VEQSQAQARADPARALVFNGVRLPNSRQPIFNIPPVVVAVLAVLGLVHAVRELLLPEQFDRFLILAFGFVPVRYDASALIDGVLPGGRGAEIWGFLTYALLHADLMHLGVNAVWLLAFASPVARRFGAGRFLMFFAFTVAAGALAHLLVHPGELAPMIGASAGVSGTMGAAARFVFEPGGPLDMWTRHGGRPDVVPAAPLTIALRNPRVLAFLAVWFGLNLFFGLGSLTFLADDQPVAWDAHVGGFLAGLLLFSAFDPVERTPAGGAERMLH